MNKGYKFYDILLRLHTTNKTKQKKKLEDAWTNDDDDDKMESDRHLRTNELRYPGVAVLSIRYPISGIVVRIFAYIYIYITVG